ncbi:hypothetical protein SAMN05192550_0319 [Flavobacterium glycines]|uniref:DUF2264 domain-containing protein n=1 Tax=Flavobacterium glycines TaxID=551990 RepID=A0A1B9DPH9_9FLAO|nr:DUF2264 domain-containing protein [Flavobacterium glycines]OCB71599.1 hypothetical protein FBGL_10240 [Flavobacterium glycines]GEL10639.1 hypothetical protein FGL01_13780 [Flavobacterium glycines]SDI60269.1 hypothetical protein SAMN05192550_0319 [Flavobacterium glycines]
MNKLKTFLLLVISCNLTCFAQQKATTNEAFQIVNPDYKLSPYTGMTKQHWKDAAMYLLEGAFSYVHSLDDPMKFPKQEGKSYPVNEAQVSTEKLEGLCRTLFIASPLLKENPELVINNIKVADYYRCQIAKLTDPASASYIEPRSKNGGASQKLVEFGALAVSMLTNPEVLWNPLPQEQKDKLAKTMLSYGDGPTVDSNWKFFNVFVLSFFKEQGYVVNEKLLLEYLQKSLKAYRGNGWYNDSPAYDYYSMWAFQMYGMIWSEYFGKIHYPEIAAQFEQNFSDLKYNYPNLFSKNGEMIMWGRSISYRTGAIIPFPLMGFQNDGNTNYGWMRRISSGVIKQFFTHPDFMKDKVPTLGFYGAFEPAVQVYSCRGSVYWMGKAFLALLVPDNNPFWTAKENNGDWDTKFKKDAVYNKYQGDSNILITDYPNIGASEVRAWCHEKVKNDWQKFRSTENYNRLSYSSAFPWQADGTNGEVAMNYVIKNKENNWEAFRLYTFKKFENEVYYRDVVLETDENIKFSLADIPLANGILRVDKNNSDKVVSMRLGHYALPKLDKEIRVEKRKIKGHEVTIIDNGKYQLAMVSLLGWGKSEVVNTKGLHPESNESSVINLVANTASKDKGLNTYATLMLWKKSGEKWKNKELLPVRSINQTDVGVSIQFNSGKIIRVDFK